MKKIFILSMLLVLSCGYAYGEIIRVTNNNVSEHVFGITTYGHVLFYNEAGLPPIFYYYNGNSIVELGRVSTYGNTSSILGNILVYGKQLVDGNASTEEIFLFDGQNETQITHNNYRDSQPMINGFIDKFIAWEGYPDYPNQSAPPESGAEIFLYKPDQPTAVQMSALKATSANKAVKLNWQTESETDNAGFNVWRAEGFVKVNNAVIPALGSPTAGSDYDFVDQWVLNGKRYFYLLEDIDTNGISTFHGPVKATPRWIYGAGR